MIFRACGISYLMNLRKAGDAGMWRFKSCPRCKGDILLDRDHNRWYELCLQCGYRRDLQGMVEAQQQAKIKKETSKNVREKRV